MPLSISALHQTSNARLTTVVTRLTPNSYVVPVLACGRFTILERTDAQQLFRTHLPTQGGGGRWGPGWPIRGQPGLLNAAVQHEGGWTDHPFLGPESGSSTRIRRHPGGGGPPPSKYVENPLKENFPHYYQNMADGVLDGTLRERMREAVEDQDLQLQRHAPQRSGALKKAGSYTVFDGARVYAHKASKVPYEDPDPGNPPGFVISLMKRAGYIPG